MAKKGEKGIEYKLSVREQKFVSLYLEYGDASRAVREAKFNTNAPAAYARKLLAKPKIQAEVQAQMALFRNECIASSQEIMNFYTLTMRGEVKDQFGLEASLADRIKAADALAKRQIDAVAIADRSKDNAVTIKLCWDRTNSAENPELPDVEDNAPYATSADDMEDDMNEEDNGNE